MKRPIAPASIHSVKRRLRHAQMIMNAIAPIAAGPVCSLPMPAHQPSPSMIGASHGRDGPGSVRASSSRYGTNSASIVANDHR